MGGWGGGEGLHVSSFKNIIIIAIIEYDDISSMPSGHSMMTKRIKGS